MFASADTCKFRSCHIKLSRESTFSGSPHVEILTAVLAQSFKHTSRSVPVQRAVFRDLSLSSDKTALSCVPLPTRFRSLSCCDMSCCGARSLFRSRLSVGYAPCVSCARSGQEGAELANVLTNATHNGCLVCPLHLRSQVSTNSRSVVATTTPRYLARTRALDMAVSYVPLEPS